jgi:glycosyltransferase involved in cell wall biosynthesis
MPGRSGWSVIEPVEVLFLAGRLDVDEGQTLLPLSNRLRARGILARVVCLSRGNLACADERVYEVPALAMRWLQALCIRRLQADIEFARPAVLHAVHEELAPVALALAESWHLPYLQTVNDFPQLQQGLRVSRRWFRGLVAASPEVVEEVTGALGLPARLVELIACGIEGTDVGSRSGQRTVPVVGAAGKAHEVSGLACFLHAARLVVKSGRDAEFLIAIPGHGAIDLRRLARSLQIADRVTVTDPASLGGGFWSVLHVYCQPSLVPSTGRALVQALAAGVPSLATNVKGLCTLIDDGLTGLLVSPDDPRALALAIMRLLEDPQESAAMAARGRTAICGRFDPEVEADLLAALYRRHAAASAVPAA